MNFHLYVSHNYSQMKRFGGMEGPPDCQLVGGGGAASAEYCYSTLDPVTLLQNLPSRQLLPNLLFSHVKTVIT